MINELIGEAVEIDGRTYVKTKRGVKGCALYGPYIRLPPGHYMVEYQIILSEYVADGMDDVIYAYVDVACDFGNTVLARSSVCLSQIVKIGNIHLFFDINEYKDDIEYRVFIDGKDELLISATPILIETPQRVTPGTLLRPDEAAHLERYRLEQSLLSDWPGPQREQLITRIRKILAKLRPMRVDGRRKARFGSSHDGGYVLLDDFQNIDTALSFGVEHNAAWDIEMANRGISVRQYDHTIDNEPSEHPLIKWEKKKISPILSDDTQTISNILTQYHNERIDAHTILKIDIEHDEWQVFDATPDSDLQKFRQITGEFHGFDYLADRRRLEIVERVIDKLARNFAVIHVHANNHCGVTNIFGVSVPYVLELTFVSRSVYEVVDSDEIFPGPLDAPCDPSRPDIFLGAFRY